MLQHKMLQVVRTMPSKSTDEVWQTFGAWVRSKRESAGMSQAGAARRAEIDRQQWYRIEAGKSGTRRDTVLAIARAISADPDEALTMAGYAPTQPVGLPQNRRELLDALERIGVAHIEFHEEIDGATPEELQEVLDAVRIAVAITITKQGKQ